MSSNNKAINFLHCALAQDIYTTISSCETAKEIWDKLNVTYEEDKKHKAYVSWENEDDSSIISDKDEVANICLMANKDEGRDMPSTAAFKSASRPRPVPVTDNGVSISESVEYLDIYKLKALLGTTAAGGIVAVCADFGVAHFLPHD
ncbi:hypothetical protein PIB30_053776 [Stylosanthes scabra]|uniref:Uncharacterized protein n=1 Tax=Stylosanthes scabra TaxID=79078 RepID=A0ABU6VHH6_9FABA|nr:hypothetical protein [Stylosanthes scabra]